MTRSLNLPSMPASPRNRRECPRPSRRHRRAGENLRGEVADYHFASDAKIDASELSPISDDIDAVDIRTYHGNASNNDAYYLCLK